MSLILVRMKKQKNQKTPDHTIATFGEGKMGRGMRLGLVGWWVWWGVAGFILTTGTWPIISVCLTSFAVYSMVMMMMTHSAVGQPWGSGRHSRSSLQVGCFHFSHLWNWRQFEVRFQLNYEHNWQFAGLLVVEGYWRPGRVAFVCLTNLLSSVKSKGVNYRR